MTDLLLIAPIVGPLPGAAASLLLRRHPAAQRILGLTILVLTTAASVVILIRVEADGLLVADVGGWPTLANGTPPVDTDHDGMPDAWETAHSLNPNNVADRNGHDLNPVYTNLEVYLNELGAF